MGKKVTSLLELQRVTKRFGGISAVTQCSFKVLSGKTHGVIGPNGAGKTTVFNLITGIYRPTEGRILFREKNITGLRPNQIAQQGIGRTFQNIRLFKNLTVLDNVRIAFDAHLRYPAWEALLCLTRVRKGEVDSLQQSMALLQKLELDNYADVVARHLPYGSQRRLEIARALALRPSILLLDEPAAGMNPVETERLGEFLLWMRDTFQVTILLIEHHMKLVMRICDSITVLDFGVTIAEGTAEEVRSHPRVVEAYLGEDRKYE